MTIDLDIDLSFLVDTEQADANDGLVALQDLETALEDYLNGLQAKERTLYTAPTILTISAGVITTTLDVHTVAAQTGTADDLDTITAANNKRVRLKADTGDTITIKHGTGNITTLSGQDVVISGNEIVELFCLNGQWCVIGDGGNTDPIPEVDNRICQGRLTLTTAVPVTTSDVTAATTLYFTPYDGNRVALYDGSEWDLYPFTERSIAIPASTNTNYDVFLYDSAGTLTLELVAWTNGTTRATAIVRQDGVWVKDGTPERRYVGTIRTTGVSGQCEDSKANRFVWNAQHRVERMMSVHDNTDSWTYATATWRSWNNSTANRVNFIIGVAEDLVRGTISGLTNITTSSVRGAVGAALDATAQNDAEIHQHANSANTGAYSAIAHYSAHVAIGFHFLQLVELASAATVTFYGDNGSTFLRTGGIFWIRN